MAIAIIIGTHGAAAEQLLKTAEMLLGEQDNVAFIDFVPGENAETLIVKYNEKSVGWIPAAACCSWWIPGAAARSTPPAALRSTKKL